MRRSWRRQQILALIAAAVLVAASAAVRLADAQEAMSDVEQSALEFVNSVIAAYVANDVEAYLGHYAKDLTWWGPGGRSSWDAYHDSWTANVENNGGVASAETSDAQVRVSPSGDAAVVSFLLTADYHRADGSVGRSYLEVSMTLMKRNGNWKVVHLHFSSAPQDDPSN